jgi:hypothetical protein
MISQRTHQVFISYSESGRGSELAERVRSQLLDIQHLQCFLAKQSIEGGSAWLEVIEQELRGCLLGMVLLTPESIHSAWVRSEVLCLRVLRKVVVPVAFGVSRQKLPDFVQGLHCVDLSEDKPEALLQAVEAALHASSWTRSGEEFLAYLHKTRPLVDHEYVRDHFAESHDGFVPRHFVRYWHHNYCESLTVASKTGILPLPSDARMQAAVEAVDSATKSIRAITVVRNDVWITSQRYLSANVAAIERGVRICRLVIFPNSLTHPNTMDTERFFRTQLKNGISLKYFLAEDYKALKKSLGDDKASERNLLICDDNVMTISSENDHTGELIEQRARIRTEVSRFDDLWSTPHARDLNQNNLKKVINECSKK